MTVLTLVNLVNNAGFDPVVYRDLDAAARALVSRDDAAPLLRLAALSLGFDDTNYPLPEFSDGLYYAVGCTDYVQLFSRTAAPAARARQYAAALRREPAAHLRAVHPAPVDLAGPVHRGVQRVPALAVAVAADPADHPQAPAGPAPAAGADPVRHPRLADAQAARRHPRGPADGPLGAAGHGRQPDARALQDADDACPASIYQRFVLDPGNLRQENTSCAARVTPVHTVGAYPRQLARRGTGHARARQRRGPRRPGRPPRSPSPAPPTNQPVPAAGRRTGTGACAAVR